jgi:RNA polymerase sigma factor (sigma-70 family)
MWVAAGVAVKNDLITELFDRYGPMVYRRALNLLGNTADAEEATQEIFIRAFKGLETFDGRSQPSTWLYSITTHHCLNKIRDAKRRRELWDERVVPEAMRHSEAAPVTERILSRYLLAEAEPSQALAALCVFVEGMSHDEAASVVGVSRRSIGNLLERFQEWAIKRVERLAVEKPP